MKPGVIYRLQWNTVPSLMNTANLTIPAQVMIVDILDTETLIPDADDPTIIPLQAAANPLTISIINNDRDKFSPIRAKQARIEFESDKNAFQDMTTFSDSSDNRWKVEITSDGDPVFYGFLMLSDSSQAFQPDPNIVVLTASDHLGVLKDIILTNDNNENPSGKYRIGQLVAMCLKKTGLSLDIVVINNLRTGSGEISPSNVIFAVDSGDNQIRVADADGAFFYIGQVVTVSGTSSNNGTFTVIEVFSLSGTTYAVVEETVVGESALAATLSDDTSQLHFYDGVFIDVKTFEAQVGISEFCYTVLEKILGEDCFLSQWKGKWHIMRIDEYDGNPIYPATFDPDGNFVSFDAQTSFSKSIGANETRRLANANGLLETDRPNKFIQEDFKFDFYDEILCNYTLVRGTHNAALSTDDYEALDPECWAFEQNNLAPIAGPSTGGFIKVISIGGIETARYLQIAQASTTLFLYFRSQDRISMQISDKFKFSVDWKYDNNPGGSGHYTLPVAQFRLYGDDGSHWTMHAVAGYNSVDPTSYWLQSNASWTTNNRFLNQEGEFNQEDLSQWQSASIESAPLPVSGKLEVWLTHNYQTNSRGKAFAALSFEYIPYLRGTYGVLTGDYNNVSRTADGFLAKREREVYIQDCLKPLFKGAMFFESGLTELYSGSVVFAAPNSITFAAASGYKNFLFYPGQILVVTGTNAGTYKVTAVIYHIVGDNTEVQVEEQTISTVTESSVLSEQLYALTWQWYTAAPFALGPPPDLTYMHPYGYIQAFSVWNQYRNANRIISSSVLGLGSMWCDALDKISLTDNNVNTNNRYFLLISFEQNWKTALWSGVFIEDYRTDIGKVYSDSHEFEYLTK